MTKEQLDYLSSRSPMTPDYLPYSYQRTAPYLLWDELSSQHLSAHSSSSSSSSLCSCCFCRAAIIIFAIILICGVFTLVGIAVYLGIITNNIEEFVVEEEVFEGRMRVMNGDKFSVGLSDRSSPEFNIKAQMYESLLNTVYQQSDLKDAYIKSKVTGFKNGSLIVYFRLHLDRRKLSPEPVKQLYELLYREVTNPQPVAFKIVRVEPQTLNISGIVADNSNNESLLKSEEDDNKLDIVNVYVTNIDVDYKDESLINTEQPVMNKTSDVTEAISSNTTQTAEFLPLSTSRRPNTEDLPRYNYTFLHITNDSSQNPEKMIPLTNGSVSFRTNPSNNSSLKAISGTASEVNIDWRIEDGVRAIFGENNPAADEMLYAEADNSHEFGFRIKPPVENSRSNRPKIAQDRSDSILHAESPTLVINRPSSKLNPNFPSNSQRPIRPLNPLLRTQNTTPRSRESSPWRPIPPPRHYQESREQLINVSDEHIGFGLRLRPFAKIERGLRNQSSPARIVPLPPRTRKPLSINDDSSALEPEAWQPHRQMKMRNAEKEEEKADISTRASELEGRVIPDNKLNPNDIFYSTKKEDKAILNDVNAPTYSRFISEEVTDRVPSGDSWITSVSVENATSIVLGNKTGINISTHNSDIPSTLIITSIVTSVEEFSGETTSQPSGAKVTSPNISDVTTYSIKEYIFNLFPELMKFSNIFFQSNQNQTTTQSIQDSKFATPTTVATLTNKINDSDKDQENYFDSTIESLPTTKFKNSAIKTTEISPAQKFNLLDLLDVEHITKKNHIQSAAHNSPMILLGPDESDAAEEVSSNESDEESNFLISTNREEVRDQESNLKSNTSSVFNRNFPTLKTTTKTTMTEQTTTTAMTTQTTTTTTTIKSTTSVKPQECHSPTLFRCQSGECVSMFSRCNRMRDCADNSDENGCSCADFIRANVMNSTLCDGIIDCWDYSDENQCEWCSPAMFVCPNARMCISKEKVCDGFADCPGGEDERACVTVAPNMTSADSGNYWGNGLVMIRREGRWGKLCMENFENFVSETQVATGDLGRVLCRTLGYEDFEEARQLKDIISREARDNETFYYEPQYSENETNSRSSSIHFVSTPCHSKDVIRVMCKDFGCGKRHQSSHFRGRIVGGSNSTPGSWPWQAAVYKEGNFMCGATLISERWLLSATHCFYQAVDHYWTVRLGILRQGSFSPYERVHRLSHIVRHPNYISRNFINDISLLRLAEPVVFSDYIRPICLPHPEVTERIINRKQLCTVVGWGQTDEEGDYLPDILQEVKLPLISAEECRTRTTAFTSYTRVNSDMFCAGMDRGGRDACLGDSGGPIMCQESEGRWAITGITSNGFGCARASRPGIYTKVTSYLNWIKKTMEEPLSRPIRSGCKGHRCLLGKCLSKRKVCDGFVDCMEGSDEKNCQWPQRKRG